VQGNNDVWLLDAARTTRFTFDAAPDNFPIWSPDGRWITFASNRQGKAGRDLYRKPSNSAGSEELLLESMEDKSPQDWSPDGKFLLYLEGVTTGGVGDLMVLPMAGDRKPIVFLKTRFDERGPHFSPDGRWVAYQSNESGLNQIYVRPFPGPGGQWQVSTSGGIQVRWRRDGRELYYIAPDGKLMAVPIAVKDNAIEPGAPVALFQPPIWGGGTNSANRQQYDVAPDGRFLINVTAAGDISSPITLFLNWKPPAK
jgi:Tol biopolymer transport system component